MCGMSHTRQVPGTRVTVLGHSPLGLHHHHQDQPHGLFPRTQVPPVSSGTQGGPPPPPPPSDDSMSDASSTMSRRRRRRRKQQSGLPKETVYVPPDSRPRLPDGRAAGWSEDRPSDTLYRYSGISDFQMKPHYDAKQQSMAISLIEALDGKDPEKVIPWLREIEDSCKVFENLTPQKVGYLRSKGPVRTMVMEMAADTDWPTFKKRIFEEFSPYTTIYHAQDALEKQPKVHAP